MGKKFTDQQIKEIVSEYKSGASKKSLMVKYEVSVKTVNKILEKNGIKSDFVRFDKASKEKAQEMALNGCSDVEISAETGISLGLALSYVKRVEKEMEQIEDNSRLIRAVPRGEIRKMVVDGTSYIDITDFVAGM